MGALEPARFIGWRLLVRSIALAWLPWMHTRYTVLAVGFGLYIGVRLMRQRKLSQLAWFAAPAMTGAVLWLGFFWAVYGTPSPAAPYGNYTQTAWRQIPPGLMGLLVDQQFGLLATAPVLALVCVGLWRWPLRGVASTLVATAVVYLLLTASYRMWWGGLSAPARFLAPLLLSAGVPLAVAWHSLRATASRHAAVALLGVSLLLTTLMVVVDHGRLAYNERDATARWADWASPLVDLTSALPAAHRDGPWRVAGDAAIWLVVLAAGWLVLRALERHRPLTRATSVGVLGAAVALAASATWAARGTPPLHPQRSQIAWMLHDAADPAARPLAITARDAQRRGAWFDLDVMSGDSRRLDPFTALQVDGLPAGRYRLLATGAEPGTRYGVAIGAQRASSFVAEMTAVSGRAVTDVVLPTAVDRLTVRSTDARSTSPARVWVRPDDIVPAVPGTTERIATQAERRGPWRLFFPASGVHPEADGFWVAGDSRTFVGIAGPAGVPVTLQARAGARAVDLQIGTGTRETHAHLEPGAVIALEVGRLPGRGAQVVRITVDGGFRPALVTDSDDGRRLGVWMSIDQNRTTPLK